MLFSAQTSSFLRRHWGLATALAILLVGVVVHYFGSPKVGLDDAYISYRYAENWVLGHGLVFNPGERVEGYSNFLFVVLLALGRLVVPGDSIHAWSVFLNGLFLAGAIALFQRHLRRGLGALAAHLGAILFAFAMPMWKVANDGLATSLVVLLQLGLWVAADRVHRDGANLERRDEHWLWAAIAALVLTRADGFVMPVILVVYLALQGRTGMAARALAVIAGTFGICTLARFVYYGYPLPNTVYLKVAFDLSQSLELASRYFGRFLNGTVFGLYTLVTVLLVFVSGYAVLRARAHWRDALPAESFFALGWIAYLCLIGGDVLGVRWLLILVPLGIAAAIRLQAWLGGGDKTLIVVFCMLLLFHARPLTSYTQRYPFEKRSGWRSLGLILRESHPGQLLAVDAAGQIPYFSKLRTIDMLGLNDTHIAHQEPKGRLPGHSNWDVEYVLAREPDLIGAGMTKALDLQWGLDRVRYRAAGYRLRYLVAPTQHPEDQSVIDVRGLAEAQIVLLHKRRYTWALLERIETSFRAADSAL